MTHIAIAVRYDGRSCTIVVSGELDLAAASSLTDTCDDALDDPKVDGLEIDLSAVSFIDSTGVGALIHASNSAKAATKSLTLRKPSERVRFVMRIAGLDDAFTVRD